MKEEVKRLNILKPKFKDTRKCCSKRVYTTTTGKLLNSTQITKTFDPNLSEMAVNLTEYMMENSGGCVERTEI